MVHGLVDLLVLLQLLLDLLVGLTLLLLLVVLVLSLFCFQDSPWQRAGHGQSHVAREGGVSARQTGWPTRKLGSSGRSTKGGWCRCGPEERVAPSPSSWSAAGLMAAAE